MRLSTILGELFAVSKSGTDASESATERNDDSDGSVVVNECRDCGTTVSTGTTSCPTCEGEDIVSYSID
ncbi:hypothetical protein [Natrinema gelatinilyticum]|uniref:hypothetical protein n=1 Tax=Natrinema gelatinilyticum TaxID=2961571 RepID=UPI0020C1C2FA|nr:hypothetical protein [Natrinema gelatinilyticum]